MTDGRFVSASGGNGDLASIIEAELLSARTHDNGVIAGAGEIERFIDGHAFLSASDGHQPPVMLSRKRIEE